MAFAEMGHRPAAPVSELWPPQGVDPGKVRISSDLQVMKSAEYLVYEKEQAVLERTGTAFS